MEKRRQRTLNLTVTALLTALGILIPAIMPIRLVLGTASYTLASHVPVNMAMMHSPAAAALVAIGSGIGFFLSGMNIVIVLRALSHIIYASIGAKFLEKRPSTLRSTKSRFAFSLGINIIHGLSELVVVFLTVGLGITVAGDGFINTLLLLVGLGTLIHGMVDFEIAYQLTKLIQKRTSVRLTKLDL